MLDWSPGVTVEWSSLCELGIMKNIQADSLHNLKPLKMTTKDCTYFSNY